jgi:hypothetical protein
MATRLYLNNASAPQTPTAVQGGWDQASGYIDRLLDTYKSGALTSISIAETSATAAWDVLLARFVGARLNPQTISGTLDGILGLFETSSSLNAVLHLHAYVMDSTGNLRGTLLNNYIEASSQEWSGGTTTNGRRLAAAQTLSSVDCQLNDRVVIEIGMQAQNTSTTSMSGRLYYGGTDPSQDLTSGGDGSSYTGWLEFSQDLSFVEVEGRVYQEVVELAANPVPALMTYQVVQELAANPQPQLLVYQHVMETAVNPQPELRTYQHVIEVAVVPVPVTRPFVQAFIVG